MLTFRQCMEEMLEVIDRKRLLVSGAVVGGPHAGRDPRHAAEPAADRATRSRCSKTDNVVSRGRREGRAARFAGLGIQPQSTAAILPTYLWRYRPAGQFTRKSEA